MMVQQKDSAKKIAGIIFILASVLTAVVYYGNTMGWIPVTIMYTIFYPWGIYGFIGIAIALFLKKRMIAAAFSAVAGIHTIIEYVELINLAKQPNVRVWFGTYFMYAGLLIMFAFLALAMIFPKYGYKFGVISEIGIGIIIVQRVFALIYNVNFIKNYSYYTDAYRKSQYLQIPIATFTTILLFVAIMFAIWNLLIVFAEDMPMKKAAPQLAAQTTLVGEATEVAEKLLQLKELLDLGVITQDEFDSKKKELL